MVEVKKPPVTREAALRIALAARAMPKVSLPALIEQLQRRISELEAQLAQRQANDPTPPPA